MDITILMSWMIWGLRNALIFESEDQNIRIVKRVVNSIFLSNL